MKEDQLTKDILNAINDETRELLDKQDLVDFLADSQDTAKKKVKYEKEMKDVKNKFKDYKERYTAVSNKVANLYFVVSDMNIINVAYMWSLEWFRLLYIRSIKVNDDKDKIEGNFRSLLYKSVCISLFEKDKLLFSFLMALKLMTIEQVIDSSLINFFFVGGVRTEYKAEFPEIKSAAADPVERAKEETETQNWFTKVVWTKIEELDQTNPLMKGYRDKFKGSVLKYNEIFEKSKLPIQEEFPFVLDNFDPKMKEYIKTHKYNFLKLILVRVMRPEFVVRSIK